MPTMITPSQQLAEGMLSNLLARMPVETLNDILRSAIEAGKGDKESARQFLITGFRSMAQGAADPTREIEDHEVVGMIMALLCIFTLNHSSLEITPRDHNHHNPSEN